MKKPLLLLTAMAAMAIPAIAEDTPAFPGAEGFARYTTTGGRGGAVYHVTTLEDGTQEGTFRWACSKSGKRTIVFDVSGTIHLTSQLKLSRGDVTIAGQTAPGDGICIADYPFQIAADNVIIRFMRFRLGNEALKTNPNAHEGDGLGGMDKKNIIVDHCSVSWSIDECLSVYGSKNTSVQWCLVEQSLVNSGHSKGSHGYGGNWGGSGASYHHNAVMHHTARTPRFGPRPGTQTDERMDYRNNVIYNYGGNGCYGGEGMNVNVVNNYYKPGSASPSGTKGKRIVALNIRTMDYCLDKANTAKNYNQVMGTNIKEGNVTCRAVGEDYYIKIQGKEYPVDMEANTFTVDGNAVTVAWNSWKPMLHTWAKLWVEGNVNTGYADVTGDNWTYGIYNQIDTGGNDGTYKNTDEHKAMLHLDAPLDVPPTTTHSAEVAFEKVLEYAGASLHRDEYDAIMVNDTRTGTASFTGSGNSKGFINSQDDVTYADGSHGFPALESLPALTDTDGDGMPDAWETANNLNPADKSDGATKTIDTKGMYTNLEVYINSLVEDVMKGGNSDAISAVDEYYPVCNSASVSGISRDLDVVAREYYMIDGRKVADPTSGVYIMRVTYSDGTSSSAVIKK